MTKNKFGYIFLLISLFGLSIATLYNQYAFHIHTFFWHMMNPSPIEWNNFKIVVPDHLKGRYEGDNFLIFKLENPCEIQIVFDKMKGVIKDPFDFESYYADDNPNENFIIKEEREISLPIGESIWIKAVNQESEPNKYLEAVYLKSRPIRISFLGEESDRDIFENIITNLK